MPKNTALIAIGGIALLVAAASFSSGKKASQPPDAKEPTGVSANQLKSFQEMIARQSRDAAAAKRRLDEKQLRDLQEPPTQPTVSHFRQDSDGLAQRQRERAANAPFASNFSYRAKPDEQLPFSLTSQLVLGEEVVKDTPIAEAPSDGADHTSTKESGTFLSAREGSRYRLYEGTVIQTTLLNQLDGAFTGPVRCTVSKDVLSQDGSATVLIPVGSRFIGSARKVTEQNQARLAVTFARLILPNGYSIQLDEAPALDATGATGLKDKVDNHRARAFGLSGAIGLIGGLARVGLQGPFAGVVSRSGSEATTVLNQMLNTVPTITIREGHPVIVYLPDDLLLPEYRVAKKGTP